MCKKSHMALTLLHRRRRPHLSSKNGTLKGTYCNRPKPRLSPWHRPRQRVWANENTQSPASTFNWDILTPLAEEAVCLLGNRQVLDFLCLPSTFSLCCLTLCAHIHKTNFTDIHSCHWLSPTTTRWDINQHGNHTVSVIWANLISLVNRKLSLRLGQILLFHSWIDLEESTFIRSHYLIRFFFMHSIDA